MHFNIYLFIFIFLLFGLADDLLALMGNNYKMRGGVCGEPFTPAFSIASLDRPTGQGADWLHLSAATLYFFVAGRAVNRRLELGYDCPSA